MTCLPHHASRTRTRTCADLHLWGHRNLLHVWLQDIEPFLTRVRDPALRHSLAYGVGLLTETQQPAEQAVVNLLFESGAIQVGRGALLHAWVCMSVCACERACVCASVLMCVHVCACARLPAHRVANMLGIGLINPVPMMIHGVDVIVDGVFHCVRF